MATLDGESIIVTGASGGLGRSMSLRFSREGAHVTLVSRSRDKLEAVADEAPGETLVAMADVTEREDVEEAVAATVEATGGVDTLVNNAGIGLLSLQDESKEFAEVTEEEWNRVIDTNLKGVYLFTRAVLPHMVERGRGNVINISSGLGRDVYLVAGSAMLPYTVSKFGLEAMTQVVALEYGERGINANSLDPGGQVDTGFWDHLPEEEREQILPPDVMNDAAVLLAAQDARGVSGEAMDAESWEERLAR